MATGFRYELARSSDMTRIGTLRQAHDRTLKVDLNKSGTVDFWLSTRDELSRYVWPWATCIKVFLDDGLYWSGPVTSRNTDMATGRVQVSAVDWFDRLMRLLLVNDPTLSFSSQDAGAIVTALLAKAKSQDPYLPITIGEVQATQTRTITYSLDQNIGQAILDLVALESGFDWYIDPSTRQLNIVTRRGFVRSDLKWMFIGDGKSQHSNLSNCVENVDGTTVVNDIYPRGKTGSGHDSDLQSQADLSGVFQEAPSLSDVVDANILNAFAGAEIVYRSQPRVTYTMSPKTSMHPGPQLFKDFDIGDVGFLTARRDFINVVDQAQRVFGASLSIADSGTVTINNLSTTAS